MARVSGTDAGGRRTLDFLQPGGELGAHGGPWRYRSGPSWQGGRHLRHLTTVVPRQISIDNWYGCRGGGCSPPVSELGHLQPSRAVPSDGSLSPDSCRPGRVPLTAELGQNRTRETGTIEFPKALPHSALIPNSLMIGHHFSASAFTSAPSVSGVCRSRGKISNPRAMKRDRTAGSASAPTAAALSLPTMS